MGEESDQASTLAEQKSSLERIRLEETLAEMKRFQLCKNLVDANYERKLELSRNHADILDAMLKQFKICSDKLTNILSFVKKNQRQCLDFRITAKPMWEQRERLLEQNLTMLKRAGEINTKVDISVSELESDVKIWDLPNQLATISQFCRPAPRDVLMEGWLYQQCPSMAPLQPSSWIRRWFILKPNGIYYLESSSTDSTEGCRQTKVKLFDVLHYTIREHLIESPARFCFQLVDSNNKSVLLQARGPKEMQLWVDRIRASMGSQLAKYDLSRGNSCNGMLRTISSEISLAVVDVKSSISWHSPKSNELLGEEPDAVLSLSRQSSLDSRLGNIDNPLIMEVFKANPTCADCGACSPEWTSLNLGILVCLECSGVHRSLGCHVSKVRSLILDELSDAEASMLLESGNEKMNKIYEEGIQPEAKALRKLACMKDRSAREEWIKSKYVKKEFVANKIEMSDTEESTVLQNQTETQGFIDMTSAWEKMNDGDRYGS